MILLIRPTASAVLISPVNGNQSERLIVSKLHLRRTLGFVLRWPTSLALLAGLVALPVAAQTNGSISGTVLDPSGAAITGASVSLVETATGHHSAGKTSSTGHYEFSALPQGRYTLKIVASGWRKPAIRSALLEG